MLATVIISNNSSVIMDNQFYYSLYMSIHKNKQTTANKNKQTKKHWLSFASDAVYYRIFLSPNRLGNYYLVEINDRELEIIMSWVVLENRRRRQNTEDIL